MVSKKKLSSVCIEGEHVADDILSRLEGFKFQRSLFGSRATTSDGVEIKYREDRELEIYNPPRALGFLRGILPKLKSTGQKMTRIEIYVKSPLAQGALGRAIETQNNIMDYACLHNLRAKLIARESDENAFLI